MTAQAAFTGFENFELTGVGVTDRELGHGSYATVLEVDYMGLKCAGKKLHGVLVRQGDTSYTVRRFKEECRLLSQVRHPNIVQFLGVHFRHGDPIPILVMEFLPTNLTSCIEQYYGILPKEISYSILHEVALGLNSLHGQTPPIIHRDLSSNNVLLTPNMTAKISDLGVARILNLTLGHFTHMTQTPGTPAFMPPEVMVANPKYDVSVDEFSYGVLVIHILSGRWPEPQVGQVKLEEGKLVPVSEAERREVFLQAIGNDHPLMDLILTCIDNDPSRRVPANKMVKILSALVEKSPTTVGNRLETLRRAQVQDAKIRILSEEVDQKTREIEHLTLTHTGEIKALQLKVKNLDSGGTLLKEENAAEIEQLKANVVLYESQIEHIESVLKQLKTQQARERDEFDIQLKNERHGSQKLSAENLGLRSEVTKLKVAINSAQSNISLLEADIAMKDFILSQRDASLKRSYAEIDAKSKAIQSKDTIISEMEEQLIRMRHYLATNQQVYMWS